MRSLALCLLALAACGDDSNRKLPDAPAPDDAPIDVPPNTPVTLTITLDGQPVPDVQVYFQNPDNSVAASVTTNASGVASAVVLDGGFVTAVRPRGPTFLGKQLKTFTGVKAGDQLQLAQKSSTFIGVTINPPINGAADAYDVYTNCSGINSTGAIGSGAMPSLSVGLYDCGATIDVLVQSFEVGSPSGWFYKADVPVSDGATIDLTAETYQTTNTDVSLAISGIPAEFTSARIDSVQATAKGAVWAYFSTAAVVNGAANLTLSRPPVTNARAITTTTLPSADLLSEHHVIDWGPRTTTTFDVANALLPPYTGAPTYDLATNKMTWTHGTGTATPQLTVAAMRFGPPASKLLTSWQIVAPYSAGSLTFPILPAGADALMPQPGDDVFIDEVNTANVPGGYDAVRARALSVTGPEGLIQSATGRITVETLGRGALGRRAPGAPVWAAPTALRRR